MRCHPILLLLMVPSISFAQKFGDYYIPVSTKSNQGYRLRFVSDSTIELSTLPRHMRTSLNAVFKYLKTDTTIEILPNKSVNKESQVNGIFIDSPRIKSKQVLTKIKKGFIDYTNSLIYVREKDFGNTRDILYAIDGKFYRQDLGIVNSYGIIQKSPKPNRALMKKLKEIDIDTCEIEVLRGLDAYRRFGIKGVFETIVITTKR